MGLTTDTEHDTTEIFNGISSRHEPLGIIGRGGMGAVYKARDTVLNGEIVAIKVIHKNLIFDKQYISRFRHEVIVARRLAHPNIVKVFDFGQSNEGECYFTMEYVEGRDLRARIDATPRGKFDLREALTIIFQVTLALDYAHRCGVIHRDVKPDNILIGDDGVVKLTDFSSARELLIDQRITPDGNVIGTPHYMPPEVLKERKVTPQLDIYSLGIVLFEMLAGVQPYTGDNFSNVIAQHITRQMPMLSRFRDDLPHWCQEMVEIATEKNPDDRFRSASELSQLLFLRLCELGEPPLVPCVPEGIADLARPNKRKRFFGLLSD